MCYPDEKKETFEGVLHFEICQKECLTYAKMTTTPLNLSLLLGKFETFQVSSLLLTTSAIYLYCNLKGQSNCFCNSTRLTRDQILNSTAQDMHIGFQTHLCLLGWTALFHLTAMEHFAHTVGKLQKRIIFYARIPYHDNFQNWKVSDWRGFKHFELWVEKLK